MNNLPIDVYFDYLLGENSTNILINNQTNATAIIKDLTEREYYYDKSIYVPTNTDLNTGDVVSFDGFAYIISSQIKNNVNSKQAYMKQSLFNLNFILNGKVRTFPAYAYTESTLTVDSSSDISVVDGSYKLVIPAKQAQTYKDGTGAYYLDTNLRTIFDSYALKIIGVDRTKKGLWVITAERDTTQSDDNLIDGIANTSNITHEYAVSIQQAAQSLTVGDTFQYTVLASIDEQADTSPTLTWTSSNTSVATVDANGLVTSVAAGTATVTVSYHTATDSRTVDVAAPVVSNPIYRWWYTSTDGTTKTYLSFSGNNAEVDILQGYSATIGIEKWDNDTTQSATNDTYTFAVNLNGSSSSHMTYTTTSTSITVNNKLYDDYHQPIIKVTPSGTGTQETNYVSIQLNGAF